VSAETETQFAYRWYGKKYALTPLEVREFLRCHRPDLIEQAHEAWRAANGFPAADSPLSRGHIMALVRSGAYT